MWNRCAIFLILILMRPAFSQSTQPSEFLLGADISALASIEDRGGVYRDNNQPADAISIFRAHGWNCFRLRLFVNPNGQGGTVNNLEYTRKLVKRIRAAGASFILDIHYSDTWADPQHQIKPQAWRYLSFDDLESAVRDYTASIIRDFRADDALPQIVQIGNEITGGTLWPDAQIQAPPSSVKVYDGDVKPIVAPRPYDDEKQWDRFARILKAGIAGVRGDIKSQENVRILLHIDCAGDEPTTRWFFDNVRQRNVDFDIIGQSYYPNWHGMLTQVRENLAATAQRYQKDVIIVETAYPSTQAQYWSSRKNMAWPISRDGQRQFLRELIQTVRESPRGLGVIYWFPELIPTPDRLGRAWNGGAMSLFDQRGNVLPAIDPMKD